MEAWRLWFPVLPRRNPVNLAAGVTKFMETGNKENLIYGGKKRKNH